MVKYKKKLADLKASQAWYDRLPEREKQGRTRPGSINQRTGGTT